MIALLGPSSSIRIAEYYQRLVVIIAMQDLIATELCDLKLWLD
jgi:hypothetical protein